MKTSRLLYHKANASQEQDIVIYDFKDRRVLVVDDNQLNREILVEAMREEGFIVDEAIDGSFAIEKLRDSPPGTYELVILDKAVSSSFFISFLYIIFCIFTK